MPARLKSLFSAPFICARCQVIAQTRISYSTLDPRRLNIRHSSFAAKSSTVPGFYPTSIANDKPAYAQLTNRSLIKLHGPDVVSFLNGLLPSRLQPLPEKQSTPIFTAFLSAKGRIIYDAFVYPPTQSDADGPWYIDVDADLASAVFSHLKKHKLRSKFKLEKVEEEELRVYYTWPNTKISEVPQIGGQDPRPLMGLRFLSNTSSPILSELEKSGQSLSIEDYNIHRIISGHAEGPKELISGSALPQESNVDFSGGIDFHKGCYLGQELTIRTHHTGVVRKRILPCQIYLDTDDKPTPEQTVPIYNSVAAVLQPRPETNISKVRSTGGRAGRSTGKWLGGVGNIGLALCRLEMMTDISLTAEPTNYNPEDGFAVVWEDGEADSDGRTTMREVKLRPFVPGWLRENIEAGMKARSERSKKRRQEDDDEDEE